MNTDANPVEPSDTFLDNHNPIIIRVDGHAFRTFTRGFRKPFDATVTAAMVAATKY